MGSWFLTERCFCKGKQKFKLCLKGFWGEFVKLFTSKFIVTFVFLLPLFLRANGPTEVNVINSSSNIGQYEHNIKILESYGVLTRVPMSDVLLIELPDNDFVYKSLKKAMQALLMTESGSVVFTGPAGVGKTYQMSLLLNYINRFGPDELKKRVYFHANASSFSVRKEGNAGHVEDNIKKIIAFSKIQPITILMDEVHALDGAGTHKSSSIDVLEYLKESLAAGNIKIIGTTTDFEWEHYFGTRSALRERFVRVNVESPTDEELRDIIKSRYYKDSPYAANNDIIDFILEMSDVFGGTHAEPRRSLKIVDYLISVEKIEGFQVDQKQKLIPYLSDYYNMDLEVFLSSEKLIQYIEKSHSTLTQDLIGLDESIYEFLTSFYYWSQQSHRDKPLSILIYGNKGTGKTFFSSQIANTLRFKFLKIPMQNLSPQDLLSRIATQLEMYPFTVFLLDELEKSPLDTQKTLLSILDSSEIMAPKINSTGDKMSVASVSVKNSIFIATTNEGKEFSHKDLSSNEALEQMARQGGIDVYLLDRIQKAIAFKTPTLDELKILIKKEWDKIVNLIKDSEVLKTQNRDEIVDKVLQKIHQKNTNGDLKSSFGFVPVEKESEMKKNENLSIRFLKKELDSLAEDIIAQDRLGFLQQRSRRNMCWEYLN